MVSGKLLNKHRLLIPTSAGRIRMTFLDTTVYLEGGKWRHTEARGVFSVDVATLTTALSSPSFVFLGCSGPLQRLTLPSVIHCC